MWEPECWTKNDMCVCVGPGLKLSMALVMVLAMVSLRLRLSYKDLKINFSLYWLHLSSKLNDHSCKEQTEVIGGSWHSRWKDLQQVSQHSSSPGSLQTAQKSSFSSSSSSCSFFSSSFSEPFSSSFSSSSSTSSSSSSSSSSSALRFRFPLPLLLVFSLMSFRAEFSSLEII